MNKMDVPYRCENANSENIKSISFGGPKILKLWDIIPRSGGDSVEILHVNSLKTPKHQRNSFSNLESNQIKKTIHLNNLSPPMTNAKPLLWPQLTAALAVAMVGFAIGVIVALPGIILSSLMDPESDDIILSIAEASIFSSVVNIGQMFGAFAAGPVSARFGQRITLVLSLPIGFLSYMGMAFAPSFGVLVTSRLVLGFILGAVTNSSVNYMVEAAHSSVRGQLMACNDLFRQIGVVFIFGIGSTPLTWRYVSLICGVTSMTIPLLILVFLPNSPRWLATRGRLNEAKTALTFFRGPHYDVDREMSDIWNQLQATGTKKGVLHELKLLTKFKLFKRFSLVTFFVFCFCFNGNLIAVTYSVLIFQSAKVGINDNLSVLVSGSMRIVGSVIYIFTADRFSRKLLCMVPLFFSALSLTVLGIYFYLMLKMDVTFISWLPLTCLIVFHLFSSMATPVILLLRSELMPNSVRNFGTNICLGIYAMGSFVVTFSYPYMVDSIGSHWTFWFYAFVSVFMIVYMLLFIPETKGKSLEEIGEV